MKARLNRSITVAGRDLPCPHVLTECRANRAPENGIAEDHAADWMIEHLHEPVQGNREPGRDLDES